MKKGSVLSTGILALLLGCRVGFVSSKSEPRNIPSAGEFKKQFIESTKIWRARYDELLKTPKEYIWARCPTLDEMVKCEGWRKSYQLDLDGDNKPETIIMTIYAGASAYNIELKILDQKGRKLFEEAIGEGGFCFVDVNPTFPGKEIITWSMIWVMDKESHADPHGDEYKVFAAVPNGIYFCDYVYQTKAKEGGDNFSWQNKNNQEFLEVFNKDYLAHIPWDETLFADTSEYFEEVPTAEEEEKFLNQALREGSDLTPQEKETLGLLAALSQIAEKLGRVGLDRFIEKCDPFVKDFYGGKIWLECLEIVERQEWHQPQWNVLATIDPKTQCGNITFYTDKNDPLTYRKIYLTPKRVYGDCYYGDGADFKSPDGKYAVFRHEEKSLKDSSFWYIRDLETGEEKYIGDGSYNPGWDPDIPGEESVFCGWSPSGKYMLFLDCSGEDVFSGSDPRHIFFGRTCVYARDGLYPIFDIPGWPDSNIKQIDIPMCCWVDGEEDAIIFSCQRRGRAHPDLRHYVYKMSSSQYAAKAAIAHNLITAKHQEFISYVKQEWKKLYPNIPYPDPENIGFHVNSLNEKEPATITYQGYYKDKVRNKFYPISVTFNLKGKIVKVEKENAG